MTSRQDTNPVSQYREPKHARWEMSYRGMVNSRSSILDSPRPGLVLEAQYLDDLRNFGTGTMPKSRMKLMRSAMNPNERSSTRCDGELHELKCNNGDTIEKATLKYGRWDNKVCKHQNVLPDTPSRYLVADLFGNTKVRVDCSGKRECNFINAGMYFGDPYPNVYKQVHVDYTCKPRRERFSGRIGARKIQGGWYYAALLVIILGGLYYTRSD